MQQYDFDLVGLGHRLAVDYLQGLASRHVGATMSLDELRAALVLPLTAEGEAGSGVLEALAGTGKNGTVASAGPRYFGFVIGGSYPVAVAADALVSAWDQNPGVYATSPMVSVIEEATSRYVLDLLDLPRESGVGFVTGCQMANFTCLAAARHHVLQAAGWNVDEKGLHGAPRVNILISAEAHITILFALRLLGFGVGEAVRIPTDDQGRMRPGDLKDALARCSGPTIVCTQAGNVNSGSFDPIEEICELAHAKGAWVHVDGAFGLWARASSTYAHLAAGVEKADSWATDAHKWMNVPYDCGIAIVRSAESHRAAMTLKAEYLEQTTGAERDAVDWVPDFSRRARAVPLYATLRHLGSRGVAGVVERCSSHAKLFAQLLADAGGIRILNDVQLNQVLVGFMTDGSLDDELTRRVIAGVQREGTCWLSGTTWQGRAAMRISVSNWWTTEDDIRRSASAIIRIRDGARAVR